MGNPLEVDAQARVHIFASSNSWIEDAAVRQLEHLATRRGINSVAGMPDLHPGHHGPVGCAALADGVVHADVIGTDIGCGMQLWAVDLAQRQLSLDKLEERIRKLEGPWDGDVHTMLATHDVSSPGFEHSLGTIGGGNHFCEVQVVDHVDDCMGLRKGQVTLLVHSGSRGFGADVLSRHYRDGTAGLLLDQGGLAYLADHDTAVRYATANRRVIAARALLALRADGTELADVPHNLAELRGSHVLHRKGAAVADRGLVPIAGSRGAPSFLVQPLDGDPRALQTLAHGAGRKHDRGSMERRIRKGPGAIDALTRTSLGGRVVCTDKRLLVEEAPEAYKDIERVLADLEAFGLARVVAVLRPVLTFKTARDFTDKSRRSRS